MLSIKALSQILNTLQSLPPTHQLVDTARKFLQERWAGIVRWCSLLTSRITPTLSEASPRRLVLTVSKLVLRAVKVNTSLLSLHSTIALCVQLWIAEDSGGNGVFPETHGASPTLDLFAVCLDGNLHPHMTAVIEAVQGGDDRDFMQKSIVTTLGTFP